MNTKATGTIQMPQEIFRSMLRAYQTWEEFSDDFEDFAFSLDEDFLGKMRKARREHLKRKTRSLGNLKDDLKMQQAIYSIKTTSTFDDDIKKLDRPIEQRILEKIEQFSQNPMLLRYSLKYLPKDLQGLQKYRVGDWRVLFWVDHEKEEITLYGVEHRSNVYKRFR